MKKILSIITVCILAFFACKKDIELLHETVPEIVTEECTDITESSAVLTCKLTNQGSASVEYGFYYSEAPNNTPTTVDKTISLSTQSNKSFRYTLTGLKENTTYYVRAYARNRVGEAQGKIVQFTTLSKKLPTMGSTSVTNVTTNSATLSGNIASAGTGTVKERGFCLSTTKTPTIADSCISVGLGIGSFNYTLTELEDGITFYVRAYATSEVGTAYGETMSFTTASEQLPIVVTKSVTEITPWYATLNGELESEGTSSVTEMGFCYSATTQTPTLLDEYVKVNGSSFASVITTLSEGTTYYVRAYATNNKGTAYGETISFTTKSLPKIGIVNISDITTNSAFLSCNVTSEGSSSVIERGFYYSTSYFSTPTFSENKISVGQGTGWFQYDLNSLSEGTTYYVCAYATNSDGTTYGQVGSFTTKIAIPEVETNFVENISYASATINSNVISDNGYPIIECGVCYSTTTQPTIENNKIVYGTNVGSYSINLTSLSEETTYYVRAYATNSKGTSYGKIITFTTTKYIVGAIQAIFSVSNTKQVYFSQGNLQYQRSTGIWRFAEHQYDTIGIDNRNINKSSFDGWIDLFGWATSGWCGITTSSNCHPTSYEDYCLGYSVGGTYTNITGDYANCDWGVYNKILNGGRKSGMWRTLTSAEWDYLINTRVNAENKCGVANVNGINGIVLLPDNWTLPSGVNFVSGTAIGVGKEYYQEINYYSESDWSKMEYNGAVFLPASGYRDATSIYKVNTTGRYWSSSASKEYRNCHESYCMAFSSYSIDMTVMARYHGHSVRLVQDVK